MIARLLTLLLVAVLGVVVVAAPATAQRRGQNQGQQEEKPKPVTRADKARQLYSDAESLRQTGRTAEAAEAFEAMVKQYSTNERVPEALANAAGLYRAIGNEQKATQYLNLLQKNFPNNQYTCGALWSRIERATHRDSTVPIEEQIKLLEEYLDRYWAQRGFTEAIQKLSNNLVKADKREEADELLSHALTETQPEDLRGMINLIQRGNSGREDHENMAKIWGDAAENIDPTMPAAITLRALEAVSLQRAEKWTEAAQRMESIISERPKSSYAAWAALNRKPAILAGQEKYAEAINALRLAMQNYGIFVLDQHYKTLAELQAKAGDFDAALKTYQGLIDKPQWPTELADLLNQKHAWQKEAGDLNGAIATNEKIAKLYPDTRFALEVSLRTVSDLRGAEQMDKAANALKKAMATYPNDPNVAALVHGHLDHFEGDLQTAVREEFLTRYPASDQADEVRKAMGREVEDSPTAKAKALFDEYRSYAQEGNVDAARRRIDRLFEAFPSSGQGQSAAGELAKALEEAGKVEMAAELRMVIVRHSPYVRSLDRTLSDIGSAYNGVAKPEKAVEAYQMAVEKCRDSRYWRNYCFAAAKTLDTMDKLPEAKRLLGRAASSVGGGVPGADLEAYQARRFEGQEQWEEAANAMLEVLGSRAADPAYRPLIGEAYRFLVVAGMKEKEAELLENLANKYEGWDEADRIRVSKTVTLSRMGGPKAGEAVKLLTQIRKRHPNYEIPSVGHGHIRHLSKYSRGLWRGTVSVHPVNRPRTDMSGGWDNYLYADTPDDMIDYVLLSNEPQAYVDRLKARFGELRKRAQQRKRGYKSGIPYKTPNVPRPRSHPLPEQRQVYYLVGQIDSGMRQMQKRVAAEYWLEAYALWPHHYMNSEHIPYAASRLVGNRQLFPKALGILKSNYNEIVWAPAVYASQAHHVRYNGSTAQAAKIYRMIFTKYPDSSRAQGAREAYAELTNRR